MDNQANDDPQTGQEVSPGVTPIHDEAAKAFEEEHGTKLNEDEDDEDADVPVTSHNVFEQTSYSGDSTPTEAELAVEKTYEGGCAS
jgi:hypothetical protein